MTPLGNLRTLRQPSTSIAYEAGKFAGKYTSDHTSKQKKNFTSWRAKEQLGLFKSQLQRLSIVSNCYINAIPTFSSGWVAIMNTRDSRFTHVEEQPKLVLTSSSIGANPIHIAWFAMHPNAYKPSIRHRFGSAPQGGACLVSSTGPALSDSSLPTLAENSSVVLLMFCWCYWCCTDAIDIYWW